MRTPTLTPVSQSGGHTRSAGNIQWLTSVPVLRGVEQTYQLDTHHVFAGIALSEMQFVDPNLSVCNRLEKGGLCCVLTDSFREGAYRHRHHVSKPLHSQADSMGRILASGTQTLFNLAYNVR